jgi:hypothetical protein
MLLPLDLTWNGVAQWLRQGGAWGEVLLVFENTENVLMHDKQAEVRELCLAECGAEHMLHRAQFGVAAATCCDTSHNLARRTPYVLNFLAQVTGCA